MPKPKYKPHNQPTRLREYVRIDDLPQFIKDKYDGYRLSEQSVDWCLRVAAGQDAMSVTQEVYNLGDNRAEIKRTAREMLSNPKMQDMVNVLRDNLKHQAIVNANGILMRLELMYSEAIFDDDKRLALDILKEMSKIITNLDGAVSVGDVTISFTLPNAINAKPADIQDAEITE